MPKKSRRPAGARARTPKSQQQQPEPPADYQAICGPIEYTDDDGQDEYDTLSESAIPRPLTPVDPRRDLACPTFVIFQSLAGPIDRFDLSSLEAPVGWDCTLRKKWSPRRSKVGRPAGALSPRYGDWQFGRYGADQDMVIYRLAATDGGPTRWVLDLIYDDRDMETGEPLHSGKPPIAVEVTPEFAAMFLSRNDRHVYPEKFI